MIREIKTFRVECDFCDTFIDVRVDRSEPDKRDAAVKAGDLGWMNRFWTWNDVEVACPNCLSCNDTIGTGWRHGY